MPTYLVKCAPDADMYFLWSTVVDCPTAVSDREGLDELPEVTAERIERADQSGSSSLDGFYDWTYERFHIREVTPNDDKTYYLPRRNMVEFARSLLDDLVAGRQDDHQSRWHLLEGEERPA